MQKGDAEAYMANAATHAAHDAAANAASSASHSIFFDKGMLRSKQVLPKLAEVILGIIIDICIASAFNPYVSSAGFLEFVASTGIIIAIILAVLYIFHIREKIAAKLRMNFGEMVYAAVWCFFCFAGATACVVHGSTYSEQQQALIAAGFFGYVAMVVYGIEAFLMFHIWRTNRSAQAQYGQEQVTTPAY